METRAAATAATRARLVDAALEVLGEVGVDSLTMQEVAQRADVALRTLYNHFSTKDELLSEAVTTSLDEVRRAIAELMARDGRPRDQLLDFVDVYYRIYDRQRLPAAAMLGAKGVSDVDAQVTEIRSWRRSHVTRLLRAIDAEGGLRLPVNQAAALVYTLTSYATFSSLVVDARLRLDAARAVARHVLESAVLQA